MHAPQAYKPFFGLDVEKALPTCPQFSMRVAFYFLKKEFRDGITPPPIINLPTTTLLQAFNGAEERAYSCNNVSLWKAFRVSAPQPPRFAAACRSRQHGHPRQAASSRTCAGCFPRGGPGASEFDTGVSNGDA